MKIYKLSWYDEDDYGPMSGIYIIVREENEENARKESDNFLRYMYNETIENLERKYEKYSIEDITDNVIISSGHIGIL